MGVLLLDSLNYIIFDVSILPLHNSLQTPPKVLGNQQENGRILSKRVKNIGDMFSQSRNRCPSVCVAPVLYIAPEEIIQRTEIGLHGRQLQPPFFEQKTVWNDALLAVNFNQILGQISRVCLSHILLKPKFWKFFHNHKLGEDLFFQYLPINRTINVFLDNNRTNKPLCAERRPYGDFLWMQALC